MAQRGSSRRNPGGGDLRLVEPERPYGCSPRPRRRRAGPVCGFRHDDLTCDAKGDHWCAPRAWRVRDAFAELMCHTKGRHARQQFALAGWQWAGIVAPAFGEVVWDPDLGLYRRRYRVVWIELGRKNGKSELLAAVALYLLALDDEEQAEVYGCAKTKKQAAKVFDVADRMVRLSPDLAARLKCINREDEKRVVYATTGSYYEAISADPNANLGHNPHGIIFDEVLAQADARFWEAMRTAMGARHQPMLVAATTAGDDSSGFCRGLSEEMARVREDPDRASHVLVFQRNAPRDADPWDERVWELANPALGSFLNVSVLREEAAEAKADPARELAFRQFRLNQWVASREVRFLDMGAWDQFGNVQLLDPRDLARRSAWAGLDLASTTDLASWCLVFPPLPGEGPDLLDPDGGPVGPAWKVLWRFWTPEAQMRTLRKITGGRSDDWARQGWLTVTAGDWIDFDRIHADIERDLRAYDIAAVGYDPKEATYTSQHLAKLGLDVEPVYQGFALSPATKEIKRLVAAGMLRHAGNPVARWCASNVDVRLDDQERVKLAKPDRRTATHRIDGFAALATGVRLWQLRNDGKPAGGADVWAAAV